MFDKTAYMKEYNQKHYQDQKEWLRQHPEALRRYSRTQRQRHPEPNRLIQQKWKSENPEKVKAYHLADYHCLLGKFCEMCGSTDHLERHHPDYSKPFEIVTLCETCHGKLRRLDEK